MEICLLDEKKGPLTLRVTLLVAVRCILESVHRVVVLVCFLSTSRFAEAVRIVYREASGETL
jgi:hypothetical protein